VVPDVTAPLRPQKCLTVQNRVACARHSPYGWGRHTCLGQYVSPVIIVESLIAMLALEGLERPESGPGELAFPFERRFGRMQLDDSNLYATTFSLRFSDTGTARKFYPATTDRH